MRMRTIALTLAFVTLLVVASILHGPLRSARLRSRLKATGNQGAAVQATVRDTQPETASEALIKETARSSVGSSLHLSSREDKLTVQAGYAKLPLSFELNEGQAGHNASFFSRGPGYSIYLGSNQTVLVLAAPASSADLHQQCKAARKTNIAWDRTEERSRGEKQTLVFKLLGANSNPRIQGVDELPGKSNYFIGNDPAKWRTNVSNYQRVLYHAVYPGIDLVYYGNRRQLEHDFIVAPGANPGVIAMEIIGAEQIQVNDAGDLVMKTSAGNVVLNKPLIYQEAKGLKKEIAGGYRILNKNRVGFSVAAYEHDRPLIIDPVLLYASYLGGIGFDQTDGVAVDAQGNIYVTGVTGSTDFPTMNPEQPMCAGNCVGGTDAFVTKFNPTLSALIYSTYLGGSGTDIGLGIAVDSSNNAIITGVTFSSDFPTRNPAQAANGGSSDAFVTKLDPTGSTLVYSTYLGGSGIENFNREGGLGPAFVGGVAVDSTGSAYVTGSTSSANFPTRNPLQPLLRGQANAYVTKYDPNGTVVYSTYYGGAVYDVGTSIAVDPNRNAYITGFTESPDFPTTAGAFQTRCGTDGNCNSGNADAFVTKLGPTGGTLVYSTYLGGSNSDVGHGIAVNSSGNAFVTGSTSSTDFPLMNPFQNTCGGCANQLEDVFVAELNPFFSALVYSTLLGGVGDNQGFGIDVDAQGQAYVTGLTTSPNFPTVGATQSKGGGGIYKSTDGGNTFSVANSGLLSTKINAIVGHPTNPLILYAATANGVFKSTDGGDTWTLSSNGLTTLNVQSLAIDANTPAILYAGTLGAGVFKSPNGGANWTPMSAGIPSGSRVSALTIDPTNSNIIYAGTNHGVFKSPDAAGSWTGINNGLPTSGPFFHVSAIVVDPTAPSTLYVAYYDLVSPPGIYKSTDRGMTWTPANTGLPNTGVNALVMDPTAHNTLYAATDSSPGPAGVFKTTNGQTWSLILNSGGGPNIVSLAVAPTNPTTIRAGLQGPPTRGGMVKSTDGGFLWVDDDRVNVLQVQTILVNGTIVYVGTEDALPGSAVSGGTSGFVAKFNAIGAVAFAEYLKNPIDQAIKTLPGSGAANGCVVAGSGDVPGFATQGAFDANGKFPAFPPSNQVNPRVADYYNGTVAVYGQPQFTITKEQLTPANVTPGDRVQYKINLTNNGPPAAHVYVEDVLSAAFDGDSLQRFPGCDHPEFGELFFPDPQYHIGFYTASANVMSQNTTATFCFSAVLNRDGAVQNHATVKADGIPPIQSNTVTATSALAAPSTRTPPAVNLGTVFGGGNPPFQTVTLTNTDGTRNLHPKSITFDTGCSGPDRCATRNDSCTGATVPPLGSCTVDMFVLGNTPGPLSGNAIFTDNTINSPYLLPVTATISSAPVPATQFAVIGPYYSPKNTAFNVTVSAQDRFFNPGLYTGTVHFTSTDALAGLPTNYTFTPSDNGMHTFSITPGSFGPQTYTVTDTMMSSITGSIALNITGNTPTSVTLSPPLSSPIFLRFSAITGARTAPPTATGMVIVKVNGRVEATLPLSNGATPPVTVNQFKVGSNPIEFIYTGDNNNAGSTANFTVVGSPRPRIQGSGHP